MPVENTNMCRISRDEYSARWNCLYLLHLAKKVMELFFLCLCKLICSFPLDTNLCSKIQKEIHQKIIYNNKQCSLHCRSSNKIVSLCAITLKFYIISVEIYFSTKMLQHMYIKRIVILKHDQK